MVANENKSGIKSQCLLCKVDVNPEDSHQDDGGRNKNCKGDVGSLHGKIPINN